MTNDSLNDSPGREAIKFLKVYVDAPHFKELIGTQGEKWLSKILTEDKAIAATGGVGGLELSRLDLPSGKDDNLAPPSKTCTAHLDVKRHRFMGEVSQTQAIPAASPASDLPWCIEHYPNPCNCEGQRREISVVDEVAFRKTFDLFNQGESRHTPQYGAFVEAYEEAKQHKPVLLKQMPVTPEDMEYLRTLGMDKPNEQPVGSALLPQEPCTSCFNGKIIEDIWDEWYGKLRGHATAEQMAAILEKARHKVVNRMCSCSTKRESVNLPLKSDSWQPIETAPKDGRQVLLYGKSRDQDQERFSPTQHVGSYNFNRWSTGSLAVNPTHWKPLSENPLSKIEDQEAK